MTHQQLGHTWTPPAQQKHFSDASAPHVCGVVPEQLKKLIALRGSATSRLAAATIRSTISGVIARPLRGG